MNPSELPSLHLCDATYHPDRLQSTMLLHNRRQHFAFWVQLTKYTSVFKYRFGTARRTSIVLLDWIARLRLGSAWIDAGRMGVVHDSKKVSFWTGGTFGWNSEISSSRTNAIIDRCFGKLYPAHRALGLFALLLFLWTVERCTYLLQRLPTPKPTPRSASEGWKPSSDSSRGKDSMRIKRKF